MVPLAEGKNLCLDCGMQADIEGGQVGARVSVAEFSLGGGRGPRTLPGCAMLCRGRSARSAPEGPRRAQEAGGSKLKVVLFLSLFSARGAPAAPAELPDAA